MAQSPCFYLALGTAMTRPQLGEIRAGALRAAYERRYTPPSPHHARKRATGGRFFHPPPPRFPPNIHPCQVARNEIKNRANVARAISKGDWTGRSWRATLGMCTSVQRRPAPLCPSDSGLVYSATPVAWREGGSPPRSPSSVITRGYGPDVSGAPAARRCSPTWCSARPVNVLL